MKIFTERDCGLQHLRDKTIAIIGYGSQGRAQALNLRDSGLKVIVGLRPKSKSAKLARKDGLRVHSIPKAVQQADIVSFLFPDHLHREVFESQIKPHLSPGKALVFAAGFSVHFKLVLPPRSVDVILAAPHSTGSRMRELFPKKQGVPAFIGVAQNYSSKAWQLGLAYCLGIGCGYSVILKTTFKNETLGDLFGEQVVLCGGLSQLVLAGFETLVKAGLPPENAYLETLNQLDMIVNLIKRKGIRGMYNEISFLAAYGSFKNGVRVISSRTKREMSKILAEINSGRFASQVMHEKSRGMTNFNRFMTKNQNLLIDRTARRFRTALSL
ncbi:MAG: ketol-acid reductoisomerase [candidate division Zixibacteria bacterium]|nr:ketol-acid reductoisomerase [candidate division Zixibacteria bacterium]